MKSCKLFLAAVVIVLFSSCSKDIIKGTGNINTKSITVPPFTSVETHYDIDASVSYGNTQELTVTGYENLLQILDFRVEDGVLKLKFNTQYPTIRNVNVVANIKIPLLTNANIHGSGDINIRDFVNGDVLQTRIHGSGSINITNTVYQSMTTHIHGSGNIQAQGLSVSQMEANIHGSGNVSATVTDKLTVAIHGSGNVYYWGSPILSTSINGSGKVIKR